MHLRANQHTCGIPRGTISRRLEPVEDGKEGGGGGGGGGGRACHAVFGSVSRSVLKLAGYWLAAGWLGWRATLHGRR